MVEDAEGFCGVLSFGYDFLKTLHRLISLVHLIYLIHLFVLILVLIFPFPLLFLLLVRNLSSLERTSIRCSSRTSVTLSALRAFFPTKWVVDSIWSLGDPIA